MVNGRNPKCRKGTVMACERDSSSAEGFSVRVFPFGVPSEVGVSY
jgi:hypothetical protein